MERLRVFKNAWFQRFAWKEKIADATLCEAVVRANKGLIDADLGSGVIKQPIARPGAGRSGGYRTLIFFRIGKRAIFAFGFAKSARDNIGKDDEADQKKAAKLVLGFTEAEIDKLVTAGTLVEVKCDEEEKPEQELPE